MASINILSLPEEVLLLILRRATAVPSLFDTDPPDAFDYTSRRRLPTIQWRLTRSMPTKRSIIRVCKLWYQLARPFLYEAFIIRQSNLALMPDLLGTSRLRSALLADESLGFLDWVKRLDISIEYFEPLNESLVHFVSNLITLSRHLEIFNVRIARFHRNEASESIIHDFPLPKLTRSLRVFRFISETEHSRQWHSKLFSIINNQPLRALDLSFLESQNNSSSCLQLKHPSVECLHIPNKIFADFHTSSVGRLTHLTIDHTGSSDLAILEKLEFIGSSLTFLDLPNNAIWIYGPDPPTSLAYMQKVAEWCPKLRDLTFSFRRDEVAVFQYMDFLPPVMNLGLRMSDGKELAPIIWSAVVKDLPRLLQATPTICVVRDLSKDSFRKLVYNTTQKTPNFYEQNQVVPEACRQMLEGFSVRVEDSTGSLIHEPMQERSTRKRQPG